MDENNVRLGEIRVEDRVDEATLSPVQCLLHAFCPNQHHVEKIKHAEQGCDSCLSEDHRKNIREG